jgi:DNA polymerase III subunit gamma/tau
VGARGVFSFVTVVITSGGPGRLTSVVTALYRRYRPETFAELIGQAQVTEPLMQALAVDRVNHAYLFRIPWVH